MAMCWTVRGSNPGEAEIFRACPNQPWGTPVSYTMGTGFSRGKTEGEWRWIPTPSTAKLNEGVDLYFYSASGPSVNFKFTFTFTFI
jgi:hypothetical protein